MHKRFPLVSLVLRPEAGCYQATNADVAQSNSIGLPETGAQYVVCRKISVSHSLAAAPPALELHDEMIRPCVSCAECGKADVSDEAARRHGAEFRV